MRIGNGSNKTHFFQKNLFCLHSGANPLKKLVPLKLFLRINVVSKRIKMKNFLSILIFTSVISCQGRESGQTEATELSQSYQGLDTATFAGGCFWCVEASFEQIKGVKEAVSGYAGGDKSSANYDLVSSGRTSHTETVQVYFDPQVISYEVLLDIFFTAHDPTQLNRQGPDVGPQYRSAIFYHNEAQKASSEKKIMEIGAQHPQKIVTELSPYTEFFIAEEYHQDYEKNHPYNPYIVNVSRPKIEKVKKKFADRLKEGY